MRSISTFVPAAAIVALASGAAVVSTAGADAKAPVANQATVAASAKAIEASQAPVFTLRSPGAERVLTSAADLERSGRAAVSNIALPPGGQLTIDWAAGAAGGGDNEFGLRSVVEFNAACQWVDYAASHPDEHGVGSALAAIGSWPTMRGQKENAAQFATLAAAYRGNDAAALTAFASLNCQ